MFNNIKIILLLLLLFGCSSTSMEFRSAKSAARAERDLERGEKFALQALNMDIEKDNALIPYFLATEIYKPQERWEEMAEMLDEAIRRNPEQKLEKPKLLVPPEDLTKENYDKMVVETIGEGVEVYREETWTNIFNQAIENINAGANDLALEKLNLCIKIDSARAETYTTLAVYYASNNDYDSARQYVSKGLDINPSSVLYEMNASLLYQEFQASNNNAESSNVELLYQAEQEYLKAIELADDTTSIKKKLIFVYIDMGKNQQAIDLSTELLEIYYDDPDLYFNVGVLYQRLAKQLYDPAVDIYNKINDSSESISNNMIKETYSSFIQCKTYAEQSKNYFLDANDLEIEETGSSAASQEMRNLIKSINVFLSSMKNIAIEKGINLD